MRPLFFYLADAARDSFFPERTLSVTLGSTLQRKRRLNPTVSSPTD
jgi:hypothetical protein